MRIVAPRIGSLLFLWLISSTVAVIALAPGIVAVFVGASAGDPLTVVVGVVTMLAFMIPAFMVLGVIAPVARCALVLEEIGVIAAIRRAFSLIRGRFWWSVLIVFVTSAIINFAVSLFQQVGSFAGTIGLALAPSAEVLGIAIMVFFLTVVTVISYVFVYAYMGGVYTLIYLDVRIRFEGFDMELARAAEARQP